MILEIWMQIFGAFFERKRRAFAWIKCNMEAEGVLFLYAMKMAIKVHSWIDFPILTRLKIHIAFGKYHYGRDFHLVAIKHPVLMPQKCSYFGWSCSRCGSRTARNLIIGYKMELLLQKLISRNLTVKERSIFLAQVQDKSFFTVLCPADELTFCTKLSL